MKETVLQYSQEIKDKRPIIIIIIIITIHMNADSQLITLQFRSNVIAKLNTSRNCLEHGLKIITQ